MIDVSIIIVSYNSVNEIIANIKSIQKKITALTYEILIVNNYTQDAKLSDALKGFSNVTIIEAKSNLGFGRANNLGLKQAKGKYILFVNPDVIFLSDIKQLTDTLEDHPEIGILGPVTYNGDGKILPSCGEFPTVKNFISFHFFFNNLFPKIRWWGNFPMKYFDFNKTREVDWISGAFMLGRKSVFKQISGFDEDFFMYNEDIDICWRLKEKGFKILFSDEARIIHNTGHSLSNKSIRKAKFVVESSRILWSKHYSPGTVRKLLFILCLGSFIREIGWKVLNLTRIKRQNISIYYGKIVSESIHYLKGVS